MPVGGHILYNLWCAILNSMHSYWTLLYCFGFFSLCKRKKIIISRFIVRI